MPASEEYLKRVPLFHDLNKRELQGLASTMKELSFNAGDTIAVEGTLGVGFFVIDEGEAAVMVGDAERQTLKKGDYFGEVALIDDGARTATVSAKTDLRCYAITSWEFKPLVEKNADIAWKLLKAMAAKLRASEQRAG